MKAALTDALKAAMTMLAGWTVAVWLLFVLISGLAALSSG